jgi:2-polyprenyl-6-methoxyphenol hydroxylase-like FAD-dependent oxidoreductase
MLEWSIRRRVTSLDGITVVSGTSVLDLAFDDDGQTVTGVVVASREGYEPHHTIEAALVVDASGRTARTGEWLERRGYPSPREERVRVDATYVTRRFVRPPAQSSQQPADVLVVLQPAIPGLPRGGIAIAQEGHVWSVSIVGYHGERPPTELPDFLAYLRRLSAPALAELASTLEPLDDGATYRFPANVRRHYEELDLFPDGLVVVGDAMCAFDPTFGQGMTVAALEALELRECLRVGPDGLARRFFAKAARHVDIPWMLVARNAPRPAGVPDDRPLAVRLQSRYVRALQVAAVGDPVLAAAFLRVTHLVTRPQSLLRPPYLWRVLTAALARAGRGSRVPTVRGGSRPAIGVWDPEPAVPTRPPVPARHIHLNNQTGKVT